MKNDHYSLSVFFNQKSISRPVDMLPRLWCPATTQANNYNDVIMGAIASQIFSLTIVCSTVYSNADQRKHQSSASLAFVGISPYKWPATRKMFPFDDVIMYKHDIAYSSMVTSEIIATGHSWKSQFVKAHSWGQDIGCLFPQDTPYLAIMGEIKGIYCAHLGEKKSVLLWNSTALRHSIIQLEMPFIASKVNIRTRNVNSGAAGLECLFLA